MTRPSPTGTPLEVWRFSDGQRGHDAQSLGLIEALGDLRALRCHEVALPAEGGPLRRLRAGRDATSRLPDPMLVVGAGHRTHLPMLAARRRRGGRVVVLMRPSLPIACFDLCIVPAHDGRGPGPGVLVTRGALNRARPGTIREATGGLVLLGGPSRHHQWHGPSLAEAVSAVVAADPRGPWQIADSRRTPPGALAALLARLGPGAKGVPVDDVDPDWLPARLARAAQVWVTEDSASMVCEALSAGAPTGVLPVPRRGRGGRVAAGVEALRAEGLVTSYEDWQAGRPLAACDPPLAEAARCAAWIAERWFPSAP